MAQSMNNIEYLASEREGNEGSRRAVGYIHDQLLVPYIDRFEVKPRTGVVLESTVFGVERLLLGYSMPIYP